MGFIKGLLAVFTLTSCLFTCGAQKTVCTKEALADIVLLVDGSWSIGTENFQRIRDFLRMLVESFDVGADMVRIGLVQYGNSVRTEFFLNSYTSKEEIVQYINTLPYMGGGTKTGMGLNFLLTNHFNEAAGSRAKQGVPQIVVVITDGQSQDNVAPYAQELRQKGIVIYAIGIKDADMDQLEEIATEPYDQHIYSVSDFTALQSISQSFIQVLCTTVEEAKRQVTQIPQVCSANLADIVFLVDGSGSIGDENFLRMKRFLHTFIEGLEIRPNRIKVGLVQFSNEPKQEFLLGQYSDKNDLLEKVDNLQYLKGGTETGKALRFLETHYFKKEFVSRAGQYVPQIAVVITDGDSSDEMKEPAKDLRRKGVLIFTIGVGDVHIKELHSIANKPHHRFVLNFTDYQELLRATTTTMNTVCFSVEEQQQALVPVFADVLVLVDSSAQQAEIRQFLAGLANQLNVGIKSNRIALAQFGENAFVEFLFNAYKTQAEAVKLIQRFQLRRSTQRNLGKALDFVRTRFFKAESGSRIAQGYKQYILVVSNGKSDDNVHKAMRTLKAAGVTIVDVDVRKDVDLLLPGTAPGLPVDRTLFAPPEKTFHTTTTNVIEITKKIKTAIETPEVTVDCEKAKVADIVFIVDASDSITAVNFKLVRNVLFRFINSLEMKADNVRVGMVLYSDTPKAEFYLNTFDNKDDILQYIHILPYKGGQTNTGKALKFARDKVFKEELGSRRGVQKIAIVITQRQSEDDVTTEAAELRRLGVNVYALGIQNYDFEQLKDIASHPHRQFVFTADNFAQLYVMETFLRKAVCNNIVHSTAVQTDQSKLKKRCTQTEEADIYFLIDDSGSIEHSDFKDMKKFIQEFLLMYNIGPTLVRVGTVKFSDNPTLEFSLTQYRDKVSIDTAVSGIVHKGGGTSTGKALDYMLPLFEEARKTRGRKVREILIVITDGKSQDKVKMPAENLRKNGVSIYAIGVKNASETELLELAGDPDKKFFVTNYDALKPLKHDIVTDICSETACEDMQADIIFLVDGSWSIGTEDFAKAKKFLNTMVSKFNIGKDGVQVGLVQFSTDTKAEFQLNTYYDSAQIIQAINGIQQMDQNTLIGEALKYLSEYFDPHKGGRTNVPKVLVVITDGESQDEVTDPAKALRDKGVTIYCIGVGEANSAQLRTISDSPNNVYMEQNFDALKFLDKDLLLKICNSADDCQKTQMADVVFLVDGSGSIRNEDFESMKFFMTSVVNSTNFGQHYVHFCVILYSENPELKFPLNQYHTKREIQEAIRSLTPPGGNTYTAKALSFSVPYFKPDQGGRGDKRVPQIMFVITDGEATDPQDLSKSSQELHALGINIYGIGVKNAKRAELETITNDKEKVFEVDDFEALKALKQNISNVICNNSKPECQKEKADLVILIDGSESIKKNDWNTTIHFMLSFIDNLRIGEDLFRVGVAQFSTNYRKEFYLNEHKDAAAVKKAIEGIKQMKDGTNIGNALKEVDEFFHTKRGSRIHSGISQNLLLITDGESNDEVQGAADKLRARNIEVFVVGIRNISREQLAYIAGKREKVYIVESFDDLKLHKTTLEVFDTMCKKPEPYDQPACIVNIGVGFDVSHVSASSQSLFLGQYKLQTFLPEIIKQISTLHNVCCVTTSPTVQTKTGFRLVDSDGHIIYDTGFEDYSEGVMNKIMEQQIMQTLAFNTRLLRSFKDKFATSRAGVKIVIIFSDGLDEPIDVLKVASDELRKSGVHALLTVALEGVQRPTELQKIEFGRGFEYDVPLTIGMQSVSSVIHKEIDAVSLRDCCNVMCKCSGQEGPRGPRGYSGIKGYRGQKGYPGFPGDEGGMGDRGGPGLNGTQGHQGCPGKRGPKGIRGYRGDTGEDGEHGVDGVDGEQGVTGAAGTPGERGDTGRPGPRGVRGVGGVSGERGLRGDPGETGLDNRFRGPKGDDGNPGLQGEAGQDGAKGTAGVPGKPGQPGRRGATGPPGARGPSGSTGLQGTPGPTGPTGPSGPVGVPGQKGTIGLPGRQGSPGTAGGIGSKGAIGSRGQKGQIGDPGDKGAIGPPGTRGPQGTDGPDGYGIPGRKGQKGDIGFPGYPGFQGESGDSGRPGGSGPKGNMGRAGNSGRPGDPGSPGSDGPPGHRGLKGPPGNREKSECELITYIRDNCVCCKGTGACPAYPTELVIGLDMSDGITPVIFDRMRNMVSTLLEGLNIAETNCPTGSRVSVVSYGSNTKYLIRFSDYHRKKELLEAVKNIALERTSSQRDIGAAMRFVGRNVFKRLRKGVLMRKVAIFLSGGTSQDVTSITTAVMEYKALDINLGVIALRNLPNVRLAFQADETGSFILTVAERPRDQSAAIDRIKQCVLCFDPCKPAIGCPSRSPLPALPEVDLDLALLADGSQNIPEDLYEGAKHALINIIEQIVISHQPSKPDKQARVALYQQSSSYREARAPVKQIFTFQQHHEHTRMKQSIFQNLEQTGGSSRLGQAVEYTINQGLLTATRPHKNKMLLVIVGDDTHDYYDRSKLNFISRKARCQGIVIFILTLGNNFNSTQVEELASFPTDQHIVHLGYAKHAEQDYARRFLRIFFHILKRQMNTYPPLILRDKCLLQQGQTEIHETEHHTDRVPAPTISYPEVEEEYEEPEEELEEDSYSLYTEGKVTQVEVVSGNRSPGLGETNAQCFLDVDIGTVCGDYVQRWYYNSAVGACSVFWFGGCGGNSNRFKTEIECIQRCILPSSEVPEETATYDDCLLKSDQGPCRAYILKWAYNAEQKECAQFWYGGCEGNANRFSTKEECEDLCVTL
ncbi:collagen alpha-6(VI) chain [Hoplias malabaricus]|uniref:collagen alpha-6(VI) chain n=1 Tax=Hoplias malabaricus TaxID=27720 RepID=UPI0034623B40